MTFPIAANLQLIYVSDVQRSKQFYEKLFTTPPVFESPRYIAFAAAPDQAALFALWSGGEAPQTDNPRYFEVGIMVPSNTEVDELFERWKDDAEVTVIHPPQMAPFGRTFVIADPDGHLIRVSPQDD